MVEYQVKKLKTLKNLGFPFNGREKVHNASKSNLFSMEVIIDNAS